MWVKLLLLFFVFSFLFRTDQSFDQDLGRHIKLGEIIFQTGVVPKTNLFSYTNPDFPFVNTHWLFGVIAYVFSSVGFLQAFLFLKIVIFLASVWLTLKIIPKQNYALLLPVGFLFLHVLRERLELRPEIFSFLYTAATYYILERFLKTPTRLVYLLPLIQLLWINTHIYFFVGLVVQGIFLLSKRTKVLALIFALSLLASLANPNGISGLLYPLNVNQNYGYTIVENQTMFLLESIDFKNPNFIYVKISLGLVVLSLIALLIRKKFELKNILLALFGATLALLNVRSFPYLIFLSLPPVLQNFGYIKGSVFTRVLTFSTMGILLFESFSYISGNYYKSSDDSRKVELNFNESIKGAMDFLMANDLPNPIFNNFDIGSYIAYRGYPKYKVFVDGRPEAYPKEFFADIYMPMQSDYSKFKIQEKKYGFGTIIFSHTDQTPWGRNFLQNVVLDKDFKLVYFDNFMVVFVKNELAPNLPLIELSKLTPNSFKFEGHVPYLRMGYFLINTGSADAGKRFLEKAIKIYPQSPSLQQLF